MDDKSCRARACDFRRFRFSRKAEASLAFRLSSAEGEEWDIRYVAIQVGSVIKQGGDGPTLLLLVG